MQDRTRTLLRLPPTLAFAAIGVAGILKGSDLRAFTTSLQQWTVVPEGWEILIATAVVAAELVLAISWFLRIGKRRRLAAAAVLFVRIVTGAYGLETIVAAPPDCFCYGKLLRFENHKAEATMLFIRNAVLVVLLVPGLMPGVWPGPPGPDEGVP